jgi:TonB family protein
LIALHRNQIRSDMRNAVQNSATMLLALGWLGAGCGTLALHPVNEKEPADAAGVATKADQMPSPDFQPQPAYPPSMMKHEISADVDAALVVAKDGSVREVWILNAPDASFATATREALSKWHFQPAMRNGQAVDLKMRTRVQFNTVPSPAPLHPPD